MQVVQPHLVGAVLQNDVVRLAFVFGERGLAGAAQRLCHLPESLVP